MNMTKFDILKRQCIERRFGVRMGRNKSSFAMIIPPSWTGTIKSTRQCPTTCLVTFEGDGVLLDNEFRLFPFENEMAFELKFSSTRIVACVIEITCEINPMIVPGNSKLRRVPDPPKPLFENFFTKSVIDETKDDIGPAKITELNMSVVVKHIHHMTDIDAEFIHSWILSNLSKGTITVNEASACIQDLMNVPTPSVKTSIVEEKEQLPTSRQDRAKMFADRFDKLFADKLAIKLDGRQ